MYRTIRIIKKTIKKINGKNGTRREYRKHNKTIKKKELKKFELPIFKKNVEKM